MAAAPQRRGANPDDRRDGCAGSGLPESARFMRLRVARAPSALAAFARRGEGRVTPMQRPVKRRARRRGMRPQGAEWQPHGEARAPHTPRRCSRARRARSGRAPTMPRRMRPAGAPIARGSTRSSRWPAGRGQVQPTALQVARATRSRRAAGCRPGRREEFACCKGGGIFGWAVRGVPRQAALCSMWARISLGGACVHPTKRCGPPFT
jgi:hypothetical protein